ncbi:hypothetical protein EX895_001153 [Sporisorium graminicola]|uniref:Uncharacterized protein n=1 Tax=Sporisorium graminicola TaxID=280036 RepID=A0A4U7KZL7_9BASI|nr:hypothetical protein EX895_001153 [Sporisorium graminicola]TKY89856.1 hypothetical protein EX895_001153 [Sporisorium graminicola]
MSPQLGHSCALTILKGDAEHPINAHAPIHQKLHPSKAPTSPSQPSRFATSFSNLRSASQAAASSGFDSSVNVHAVSDYGILLPFLDRPSEVKELLFDIKANELLMIRLCSVFGGDPNQPMQRGKDERWDEMLELLVELDRPLLDDEDWLARLESLVMERSPSLWAQLARCLGADGLSFHPLAQPSSSRFDSWALPSRFADPSRGIDSPLSPPSAASSDLDHDEHVDRALAVNVEPLSALPGSYSEQPAGKLQRSSLREATSPAAQSSLLLPPESTAGGHAFEITSTSPTSPGEVFAMSAGADDSALTNSLEDIMEEPHSSAQAPTEAPRRARSHSGKFAGLRISALTSSSPGISRRTSIASESSLAGLRDQSSSPLPTGAMSPPGLAPPSPEALPSRADTTTTSFSRHRRLSTMMVQNQPTQQEPLHGRDSKSLDLGRGLSPKASAGRRQRGVSEASPQLDSSFHLQRPRRRTESFARSFAELTSPTEHLQQLRADHAKGEADRLAERTRRISLETQGQDHAFSPSAAPADALGLHAYAASSDLLEPVSASSPSSGKSRRAPIGRRRVGSIGSRAAFSCTSPVSPPIPGLMPDGRTRHPSGSYGSRDLNESIAAFRATMGLSTSPSPSERDFAETGDTKSDAGKSSDSTTRKRKGSDDAEVYKPTSRTADTVEAKVSRMGFHTTTTTGTSATEEHQAQFQKPKHMQELENRGQVSSTSGSGLALGGGFSLAKSGANFRRQSHDAMSLPQSSWRSSFSRRDATRSTRGGEPYSLRSPPAVQRRPGGFVSLAQEYERARQGRRSSDVAFSINSNAVASSPSSSITSFDNSGGGEERPRSSRRSSDESMPPRLELSLAREGESGGKSKQKSTPNIVKGDPTPKAGHVGGGITPRASFGASAAHLGGGSQGYPFPNLLHRMTAPAANEGDAVDSSAQAQRRSLAPATPLSPLQACRTRLTPSPGVSSTSSSGSISSSPRSPSIVFPISPNPSISRAQEFKKVLDTPQCQEAFVHIRRVAGVETADLICKLITSTERVDMHDEGLLEEVAHRLGLVDHERAQQLGGHEAEVADIVLAEPGYEGRWEAFAGLCRALGVGEYELGMARKRCGPAIDTCRP